MHQHVKVLSNVKTKIKTNSKFLKMLFTSKLFQSVNDLFLDQRKIQNELFRIQ